MKIESIDFTKTLQQAFIESNRAKIYAQLANLKSIIANANNRDVLEVIEEMDNCFDQIDKLQTRLDLLAKHVLPESKPTPAPRPVPPPPSSMFEKQTQGQKATPQQPSPVKGDELANRSQAYRSSIATPKPKKTTRQKKTTKNEKQ